MEDTLDSVAIEQRDLWRVQFFCVQNQYTNSPWSEGCPVRCGHTPTAALPSSSALCRALHPCQCILGNTVLPSVGPSLKPQHELVPRAQPGRRGHRSHGSLRSGAAWTQVGLWLLSPLPSGRGPLRHLGTLALCELPMGPLQPQCPPPLPVSPWALAWMVLLLSPPPHHQAVGCTWQTGSRMHCLRDLTTLIKAVNRVPFLLSQELRF